MIRLGEQGSEPESRSSRYFEKDGYWYYRTREGVNIGPFDTIGEAELGASEFIDFIIHAEPEIRENFAKYGQAA